VKNILEAAKRKLAKPINKKKEPITLEMITKLCEKYAVAESSLSDIRVAAICVTAFHAFLRFSELAGLRSCDVKFICNDRDSRFVELYITKSKTDVYPVCVVVMLSLSVMTEIVVLLSCTLQKARLMCIVVHETKC
jgi:hypothetical protein